MYDPPLSKDFSRSGGVNYVGSRVFSVVGAAAASKLKGHVRHFFELLFGEFVFQGRKELRVDFHGELLDILDGVFQVLFLVPGPFLHLRVPRVDLLDGLGGEDEGSCGNL